jgi:hypothetical protein
MDILATASASSSHPHCGVTVAMVVGTASFLPTAYGLGNALFIRMTNPPQMLDYEESRR